MFVVVGTGTCVCNDWFTLMLTGQRAYYLFLRCDSLVAGDEGKRWVPQPLEDTPPSSTSCIDHG